MGEFTACNRVRAYMKTLLASLLLAASTQPALSQAQTVNICDRTPQVQDKILRELIFQELGT